MEQALKSNLLRLAEVFSAATGVETTAIGSRAVNFSGFFPRLSDPKTSITLRSYDRLIEWFATNWPNSVDWPADVPRPEAVAA